MTEPARPMPARPGAGAGRARLAEILRVDHAGELAAVHIYRGQQARPHPAVRQQGVERLQVLGFLRLQVLEGFAELRLCPRGGEHRLLAAVIRAGCKAAIRTAEKI